MISEIKEIKMNQIAKEEARYDTEITKREEELKRIIGDNPIYFSPETTKLEQEIRILKKQKEEWKQNTIETINNAKTLKDMGMSFNEASDILRKRNMPIVLTEADKVITENDSNFENLSDLIFVHKTMYFPQDSTIRTAKDAGAEMSQELEIDGQNYAISGKSERETLHFTLNTEVTWNWGALFRRS